MLVCMNPKILFYDPKHWRARADATRDKANALADGKNRDRLLKVAREYESLARRAEEWQRLQSEGDAHADYRS